MNPRPEFFHPSSFILHPRSIARILNRVDTAHPASELLLSVTWLEVFDRASPKSVAAMVLAAYDKPPSCDQRTSLILRSFCYEHLW